MGLGEEVVDAMLEFGQVSVVWCVVEGFVHVFLFLVVQVVRSGEIVRWHEMSQY